MVVSDGSRKGCVPLHPNILSVAATALHAGRREDVEANGYASRSQGFAPFSKAITSSALCFSHPNWAQNDPQDLCRFTAIAAASPSNPLVVEAWHSALKQFQHDCGPKVVEKLITQETKPKQLLDYIQERQQKESRSKFSRLLRRISSIGERFTRYQSALDVLAQGTPSPGCLIWGSIRMVLEVGILPFPYIDERTTHLDFYITG